jgi:hypothetical protein
MVATATKTRFSDIVLDDARLSMAAKGLFVTLGYVGGQSSLETLSNCSSDGLERLQVLLDELQQAGYISVSESGLVSVRSAGSFGMAS